MAKVGSIKISRTKEYINAEGRGDVLIEMPVNYSGLEFKIPFPSEWDSIRIELLESRKIDISGRCGSDNKYVFTGKTEAEVRSLCLEAAKKFYSAVKKTEKVILFKYEYSNKHGSTRPFGHRESNNSASVSIDYVICNKITISESIEYVRENGGSLYVKHGYTEIPHTDSRQVFFENLGAAFNGIIKAIAENLGNTDTLLKTIESGQKLIS